MHLTARHPASSATYSTAHLPHRPPLICYPSTREPPTHLPTRQRSASALRGVFDVAGKIRSARNSAARNSAVGDPGSLAQPAVEEEYDL